MVSDQLVRLVEACVLASQNIQPSIRAGKRKWEHVMFGTVRALRRQPWAKEMDPREAADLVAECLTRLGWDFTYYDGIESNAVGREEFQAQWVICLYGLGEGPLDLAMKRARVEPIFFKTECTFDFYQRFLNLCYRLQEINGEEPIALPVHRVGEELRVTGATVSAYIKQATSERECYLVQVGNHKYNREGAGKARTFRFYPNRSPSRPRRTSLSRPPTVPAGALEDD